METEYTKGFKSGTSFEQERIIKLLEDWLNDDNGDFGKTLLLIRSAE